jgi:hypothetical protein
MATAPEPTLVKRAKAILAPILPLYALSRILVSNCLIEIELNAEKSMVGLDERGQLHEVTLPPRHPCTTHLGTGSNQAASAVQRDICMTRS